MIKGLFRKIKSMFTGRDKQQYVLNNCISNREEHHGEKHPKLIKDIAKASERPGKDYRIKIKLAYKKQRFCVLNGRYGEDKEPLIKILLRTRKPRVRKKLIKRIVN